MFFRFFCGMALVVMVSLTGAVLDKDILVLRRRVSQQEYQLEVLVERQSRLRLQAQQRGTPARWLEELERGRLSLQRTATSPRTRSPQTPLLHWTSRPELDGAPLR